MIRARREILFGALVFAAVAAFHCGAARNELYWDDRHQVVKGKLVSDPANVGAIFSSSVWENVDGEGSRRKETTLDTYRPIFNLSLALDHAIAGKSPTAYHVTNVVLHALVAAVLFALLVELGLGAAPSALGALLFAAHPIALSPVQYVSARADSLAALFSLLSLLFALRYRRGAGHWAAALAGLCYLAGLLSKESCILLPIGAAIAVAAPHARGEGLASRRRIGVLIGSMLALLALYAVLRLSALGSVKAVEGGGHLWRMVVAYPWILLRSLRLFAVPDQVMPLVSFEPPEGAAGAAVAAVVYAALAAAAAFYAIRRRPAFLWPLALFALALAPPTAAVVNTGILDGHYHYMPAIFATVFLMLLARSDWRLGSRTLVYEKTKMAVLAGVLVVFGAVSTLEARAFRTERSFYERIVASGSPAAIAHLNLGNSYMRLGLWDLAAGEYETYRALEPRDARASNNLALAYMYGGRASEATAAFERLAKVAPRRAKTHYNIALMKMRLGSRLEAIRSLERALEIDPGYGRARKLARKLGLEVDRDRDGE